MRSLTLIVMLCLTSTAFAEEAEIPATIADVRSAAAKTVCRADGGKLSLFAIGSSSMQIILGPMLKRRFGEQLNVTFMGKSASGLARYDYFDWPTAVTVYLAAADPDVVVVNLGSNDGQGLRTADGTWTKLAPIEGWKAEYGRRVDAMLALAAGADRHRAVIWVGPAAHSVDDKRARGKVVDEVIRERVQAFDGRAFYVDLFARTTEADGRALDTLVIEGREPAPLRMPDGFHLTRDGVRAMIFDPIAALIAPCKVSR